MVAVVLWLLLQQQQHSGEGGKCGVSSFAMVTAQWEQWQDELWLPLPCKQHSGDGGSRYVTAFAQATAQWSSFVMRFRCKGNNTVGIGPVVLWLPLQ